jgi:class 3 adenylate cyclase
MPPLPLGSVTFLFTDIEGSTPRWEQHPALMKGALDRHDALLRAAISAEQGVVFQTAGDSLVAAFVTPAAALGAAVAAQCALQAEPWPGELGALRVRMALHTGPAELRDGQYHAEYTLNRLARLLAAGHGGQILASATTRHLLNGAAPPDGVWQDCGEHWLKDLIRPLRIYQACVVGLPWDFPPLRTLDLDAWERLHPTTLKLLCPR